MSDEREALAELLDEAMFGVRGKARAWVSAEARKAATALISAGYPRGDGAAMRETGR